MPRVGGSDNSATCIIIYTIMNQFKKMYRQKPKRVRDPNLPPPPTLLGQVKVIKDVQGDMGAMQGLIQSQQAEIEQLKTKLRMTVHRLEMLTDYVKNSRNKGH